MLAALQPALFPAQALPWRASLSCWAFFSCSGIFRPLLRSSAVKAARAVWKPPPALAACAHHEDGCAELLQGAMVNMHVLEIEVSVQRWCLGGDS